jgi:MFS transporter, Spinster family, sphingosine-1-phosphate transporter
VAEAPAGGGTPPTPSSRPNTTTDNATRSSLYAGPLSRAMTVFWLMFAVNAVNYLDRLLAVAVGPTLKAQFHLTDRDVGLLSSAFLLVYTLAAIPLGLLADRVARAKVVAVGLMVWSLASGATAFVGGFLGLFATRAAVGIGEASYYPAGTALLSAHFPLRTRARVMSRWGAGQLVGIALAFALGGALIHWLGPDRGWRVAFLCAALPGLLLALVIARVPEAPIASEASNDPQAAATAGQHPEAAPPAGNGARRQRRTSVRTSLAGMRAVLGIRTVWLVTFLQALIFAATTPAVAFLPIYVRSPAGPFRLNAEEAAVLMGLIVVAGGLAGQLLGGNLADWLSRRIVGGRVLVAPLGFALALPVYAGMLLAHSLPLFALSGTLAVLALTLPAGPLTAATQDATPPMLRATAVAVTLLLSHLLGDVWAPSVVGAISTALHERTGVALLIVGMPTLLVGGIIGILGASIYARDLAPTRAVATRQGKESAP